MSKLKIKDQSGKWVEITGVKGDKGDTGLKGEKGDAFTYSDFTPEQLASLKGAKGDKGDTGNTGAKGDTGDSGVYVGTSAPSDTNVNVWIDSDGDPDDIVTDVQIDGTSIVSNGVAEIPRASTTNAGVLVVGTGLTVSPSSNRVTLNPAWASVIKTGTEGYLAITPKHQHESTFYGLAKAAGDTTQSASSNAIGTYTDEAIVAIQKMLGVYKAPWELINDYTVPEDSETVEVITDLSGQPFELTESFIRVEFQPSLTGKNDYVKGNTYIKENNNAIVFIGAFPTIRYMANGTFTYSEYKQELIGDILKTDVRTGTGASNTQAVQSISSDPSVHVLSIMGIRLRQYNDTSTLIPSGTRIQLYGRRK